MKIIDPMNSCHRIRTKKPLPISGKRLLYFKVTVPELVEG